MRYSHDHSHKKPKKLLYMATTIRFLPPTDEKLKRFMPTLKQRVNAYFEDNNISKYGGSAIYKKSVILFSLLLLTYVGTLTLRPLLGVGAVWVLYGLIGYLRAYIGFNVLHDAAHGTYSDNKQLNEWMGFWGGDAMGGSAFMWKIQHNELHHPFTNIEGFDQDIGKYPVMRLSPNQKRLWFHRLQVIYAPILYAITTIYWVFDDCRKAITKEAYPKAMDKKLSMTKRERNMFIAGKVINALLFLVIPIIVLGWRDALIGTLIMHVVFGTRLAFVFQIAHVVSDTEFHEPPTMEQWMIHQVKTTCNFATDNKRITWEVGGLNFQIEHHLFFADISHIHYPAISSIVRDTCHEFGLPYHSFRTYRGGVWAHITHLFKMGNTA